MSMQEMPPTGGPPSSGTPVRTPKGKYPACPECQRRMTVKSVTPVLFASGLDDVVYGCEDCGTETKRTVKRG
jgi:DNA-directed RNA polymerase subunit RPC12/RpoP